VVGVARKQCFKCEAIKQVDEFYRHPSMPDGTLNKCKECTKEDVRKNYAARREQYARYERERFARPERKTNALEYQRKRRAKFPEKDAARQKVGRAVRSGKLIRPDYCTVCGRQGKVEAHHTDYSRPLDVQWLCFVCHREHGHGQTTVTLGTSEGLSGDIHA
jgi:hypothetical protein